MTGKRNLDWYGKAFAIHARRDSMKGERIHLDIQQLIKDKEYKSDDIGRSGSKIMIFDDCVLKVVKRQAEDEDAVVRMMRWLEGKVPVPKPETQF